MIHRIAEGFGDMTIAAPQSVRATCRKILERALEPLREA